MVVWIFRVTLVLTLGVLAADVWPGLYGGLGTAALVAVTAVVLLVFWVVAVSRCILRRSSRREREGAQVRLDRLRNKREVRYLALSATILTASLWLSELDVPLRVACKLCQPALNSFLTANAKSGAGNRFHGGWVGCWYAKAVEFDESGGAYILTSKRTLFMTLLYQGLAFRPNREKAMSIYENFELRQLSDDWYAYSYIMD